MCCDKRKELRVGTLNSQLGCHNAETDLLQSLRVFGISLGTRMMTVIPAIYLSVCLSVCLSVTKPQGKVTN